jgi:hypothetical protein
MANIKRTFAEMMGEIRHNLTPYNPEWVNRDDYDIIKMGLYENLGYMQGETVRQAIDYFENRAMTAQALGEKLNPLETIGAILLMESAYVMDYSHKVDEKE